MTINKVNKILLYALSFLLFALSSPLLSIQPAQQYVILVINDGARYAETSQVITAIILNLNISYTIHLKIFGDKLV